MGSRLKTMQRIETNIHKADPCIQVSALNEVIKHLGFHPVEFYKSVWDGNDVGDFVLKPLLELVELARNDFQRYGERLIKALQELFDQGKMFPMDAKKIKGLNEVFDAHRDAFLIRFAGPRRDETRLNQLKVLGLISKEHIDYIGIAFRVGLTAPILRVIADQRGHEKVPTLKEMVKHATDLPLTPMEERALHYVQMRGAEYLRPILDGFSGAIRQDILEWERRMVREETTRGIKERLPIFQVGREMRKRSMAEANPSGRDFERVARTEVINAYSHGTFEEIKSKYQDVPLKEIFVFKHIARSACKHCQRIWGNPPKYNYYRLSTVEANESNYGKNPEDWIAQVGTIHPNCTEGGLQVWVDIAHLTGGKPTLPSPIMG